MLEKTPSLGNQGPQWKVGCIKIPQRFRSMLPVRGPNAQQPGLQNGSIWVNRFHHILKGYVNSIATVRREGSSTNQERDPASQWKQTLRKIGQDSGSSASRRLNQVQGYLRTGRQWLSWPAVGQGHPECIPRERTLKGGIQESSHTGHLVNTRGFQ